MAIVGRVVTATPLEELAYAEYCSASGLHGGLLPLHRDTFTSLLLSTASGQRPTVHASACPCETSYDKVVKNQSLTLEPAISRYA